MAHERVFNACRDVFSNSADRYAHPVIDVAVKSRLWSVVFSRTIIALSLAQMGVL